MAAKRQIVFLSHGGGPMPLLGEPGHEPMVKALRSLAGRLQKPSAILVISAHWEAPVATLTSAASPALVYDYYGFAPEAYTITYPCPGEPSLSRAVSDLLRQSGIEARQDPGRGLDHGVFVPLRLMYPDAEIPCVQLSLVRGLSAHTHLALGLALQQLDYDNLLVIGSGFSFHNLNALFSAGGNDDARAFAHWLIDTCTNGELSQAQRLDRLAHWDRAPGARFSHPREEHLLPLHVCAAMAGASCDEHQLLNILGKPAAMFYWY